MIDPATVSLHAARPDERPLLANLLELYVHDLSAIFSIDVGLEGRFGYEKLPLYWTERDVRFPFVIRLGDRPAGFALVTQGSTASEDPAVFDVAEFFVLKRHRRSRVGRQAAFGLWNRIPGRWVVRVSEANQAALPFWRATIDDYTSGRFGEERRAGNPHGWQVFTFERAKPGGEAVRHGD